MAWKIPLFKIYWDNDDVETVTDLIKLGMNWATGPNIEKLEHKLAEYIGTNYAAVFNSGTSALHAGLLANNIKNGDEVIVPSFTFISTANAPLFVGAKPVFADIEEKTFGLDPEDVKQRITRKTKAIIPVHYAGCPCLIKELREIADDNNLLLIEDAAESFGARICDKKVGSFGDSAMLSFCQNKIITTGEGGAIVTDSKEVYDKLKLMRSHGRLETQDYFSSTEYMDYVCLGYNFRMSNITATLGLSQIEKTEKIIEFRRKHSKYLTEGLEQITGITTPSAPKDYHHVFQMYTIRVVDNRRDYLMNCLTDRGIMSKIYFSPVHLTYFYRNVLKYKCNLPMTEELSNEVLTLPMFPTLTKSEMDYIIQTIKVSLD